ncbi:MAG TPA: hypothetical protein VMG38_24115 [Trebonia sp.]|nr:hypothetical protein [Trebonia sp.]
MFRKSQPADGITRDPVRTRNPQQGHRRARRRGAAIGLAAIGASAALLSTALPALAFTQYGAYTEINCNQHNEQPNTCGSIPSHSTQHWIQSQVQCHTSFGASYQVIDQSNGVVVASGSCNWLSAPNSPIITTYGLYGRYYVHVSGDANANAMIRNCTSGCKVVNF